MPCIADPVLADHDGVAPNGEKYDDIISKATMIPDAVKYEAVDKAGRMVCVTLNRQEAIDRAAAWPAQPVEIVLCVTARTVIGHTINQYPLPDGRTQ